jgi:drug/metabolite transporter (DMT)-like permease
VPGAYRAFSRAFPEGGRERGESARHVYRVEVPSACISRASTFSTFLPRIPITMTARQWGLLSLLAMLWGGSFFFQKVALAALPPFTVLLARVGLAAAALWIAARAVGYPLPRSRQDWVPLVVMAALNNVAPFSLILWGQTRISSGLAAILNACAPLFTAVLAHFLTRDERLTPRRVVGVLLGLSGVVLMIGPDSLGGIGRDVLAQLAVLAAGISYAGAGIFGRRFAGTPPLVTATGQVTASTLLILPVTLLVDRPWTLAPPGARILGALVGLAIISTALGYVVYFRILATAGATNLLLVTLVMPVIALVLGALVLGERLAPRHLGGMGLIAGGLAVIDGRLLRRLMPRRLPALRPPPSAPPAAGTPASPSPRTAAGSPSPSRGRSTAGSGAAGT